MFRLRLAVLVLAAVIAAAAQAQAQQPPARDDEWTATVLEEDDFWAPHNHDRHYTHGIRFSGTSGDVQDPFWLAPFNWLGGWTPAFPDAPGVSRRYNLIALGQNMYTPENFALVNPDPRDRPYAGWAYGGIGLLQDTPGSTTGVDRFDDLELKLGLVGPGSLAHTTQTHYHLLIDVAPFAGWHAQLHDEPTLDLFYAHKWRYHGESEEGWGWDAIPQWDVRVGNVYDYAGAGGLLRLGRNLRADYGPPHIDLNTGADYINPTRMVGNWGMYVFLGSEVRAVAHNIFLDGNSFKSSASVEKYPGVGDLVSGLAVLYGHLRLAYTFVWRTPEFVHQTGADHYGSLNLTFGLKF
jgi:lipid A 3-O-deacylase